MPRRWEYKVVEVGVLGPGYNREKELQGLGADGWELVAVVATGSQHTMYLKRHDP